MKQILIPEHEYNVKLEKQGVRGYKEGFRKAMEYIKEIIDQPDIDLSFEYSEFPVVALYKPIFDTLRDALLDKK